MPQFYNYSRWYPSTPALPFCHLTLKGGKSNTYGELSDCQTLGDHLKRRRVQRGLLQRDVASKLGVKSFTLGNWEKNQCEPEVRHYPAIMDFLGYCPYQTGTTLGERLMLHRTHCGLSQKRLARAVGMDPRSIAWWEAGIRTPNSQAVRRLEEYFGVERI